MGGRGRESLSSEEKESTNRNSCTLLYKVEESHHAIMSHQKAFEIMPPRELNQPPSFFLPLESRPSRKGVDTALCFLSTRKHENGPIEERNK
jgi:hypothetical protein